MKLRFLCILSIAEAIQFTSLFHNYGNFVKNGKTMIVQYNTTDDLVTKDMSPFPLKISKDRVTEENAEVRFLNPKHPVLNYPNKITADIPGSASIEAMHLYLIAGYVFEINSLVQFKPSMVTKFTPNAPLSMDLNASFLFYDKFWVGAMYRLQESVGLNFVLYINDYLKFGYAFDFSTTDIQKYSRGSHEIMLGFDLNSQKSQFYSPRYF